MARCSARVALVEMIRTICGLNFSMSFRLIPGTTPCKMFTTDSARNSMNLSTSFQYVQPVGQ